MRPAMLLALAASTAGFALAGCGDPIAVPTAAAVDTTRMLADLGSVVITSTYAEMESRAVTLGQAAQTLADDPTEPNLAAARAAWRQARTPWEQSEGFLFGPVETDGFDPALDTWPFNATDAQTLISSATPITPEAVNALDGSLKGYHGVEYILFGTDGQRTAASLTDRDLEYLVAVTSEIRTSAGALRQQWDPAGGDFAGQF
ncbi:MAG TPA: imelysin family protein, partial [Gemmatimonadales bacterium]|nr:imelysin family protein [Gemmatimonadales bacterium]